MTKPAEIAALLNEDDNDNSYAAACSPFTALLHQQVHISILIMCSSSTVTMFDIVLDFGALHCVPSNTTKHFIGEPLVIHRSASPWIASLEGALCCS